jgi:hypothetical protein
VLADPAGSPASVQAEGWLAEAHRKVRCDYRAGGVAVRVPGIADFRVDLDTGVVRFSPAGQAPRDLDLLEQALFGPPIVIALAHESVFLLHASAARIGGAAAAFCAESGAGKSTLAAFKGADWTPIADDMLPARMSASGPEAQYPMDSPPALPLGAVFVLAPEPPETWSRNLMEHERLDPRAATFALIRHGVASRLFSQQLLKRQMRFCADVSAVLPVFRLRYPKRLGILPHLRQRIQDLVAGVSA